MSNNIIFGVKSEGKFTYIGKTAKNKNELKKSDLCQLYNLDSIRNIIINNQNIEIVKLKEVDEKWLKPKIKTIVEKYSENHPLVNAQWMIEGKRGYWDGKKRDDNTLNQLSISKYKRICQYDVNGNLVNIWDSIKGAAINVLNDYCVVNGSAKSKIYYHLKNNKIKNRLLNNFYWFKEDELIKYFNLIPKRINIDLLLRQEKQKQKENRIKRDFVYRYTILQLNENNIVINKFQNKFHAASVLKLHHSHIASLCNGRKKNNNIKLKYGKKEKQNIIVNY